MFLGRKLGVAVDGYLAHAGAELLVGLLAPLEVGRDEIAMRWGLVESLCQSEIVFAQVGG